MTAQAQSIDWKKSFGGIGDEAALSISKTNDDGYVVAGSSTLTTDDVTVNHGGLDYWVTKLNGGGSREWEISLGGSDDDVATSVQQTSDDGYIVAGRSHSNDVDITTPRGGYDYWIVKLHDDGSFDWQKSFGGPGDDKAYAIRQTHDNGYIIAGVSSSDGGDVSGNQGCEDYWIVKTDVNGNIQWQRSFGGSNEDIARSVEQTTDGGYIVAGTTLSNDGDVAGNPGNHGGLDYWIVKLDAAGNMQWQKTIGGSGDDQASSIKQTLDGGYIVVGSSGSDDGDATVNLGLLDYWIVKLNASGVIQWERSFGGSGIDVATSVQQTTDKGYIVAGASDSVDYDVAGNHGSFDYWVEKLDSSGTKQWGISLGGNGNDLGNSVLQDQGGNYVVAGSANSQNNGNVTGNHGSSDFWVVKLKGNTSVPTYEADNKMFTVYPNPTSGSFNIKLNGLSAEAASTDVTVADVNGNVILKTNKTHIDLSDRPAGYYFITVLGKTEKLAKQ